jgi:hypothetical protein
MGIGRECNKEWSEDVGTGRGRTEVELKHIHPGFQELDAVPRRRCRSRRKDVVLLLSFPFPFIFNSDLIY